jgi:hypothetical protein
MIELTGKQQQLLAKRYTENIEAYQAYLRGRYFWGKRSEEGLNKSIECFKQAVKIDPAYALAYAGMADAYTLLQHYGFATASKEETYRRARDAAVKDLEIDESLAEAHTSLASIPKEKVGWLLRIAPRLDSLRSDSSFQKLLHYS